MEYQQKPKWLSDYPDIEACLHKFLDKLDKRPAVEWDKQPRLPVDRKLFPSLFDESDDVVWSLLKSLDEDSKVVKIHYYKKLNAFDPIYKKARIEILFKSEETIRNWLDRPYQLSVLRQWKNAVNNFAEKFPGRVDRLHTRPLKVQGKSPESVLNALIKINDYQYQKLSLRQLSTRCFWGLSKVLDGQEELIKSLYPDISLRQRPLIVNIHLPKQVQSCLFIENYDTYINAVQGLIPRTEHMILIYCSGYKNSAKRIRGKSGADLHWSGANLINKNKFIDWWFSNNIFEFPVYFWGDLDFSGMGILGSLKRRFPEIQAWEMGYSLMLDYLNKGIAHSSDMAKKENQEDPIRTGCNYADTVLLAAIRKKGLFVDQEIIF